MFSSSFQCLMEEATRLHMDKKSYNVTQCLNATNTPCSTPQMKDLLDINVVKGLKICPTLKDFNCEEAVLTDILNMAYHMVHQTMSEMAIPKDWES